ncbi:hypothetical protein ACN081_00950 [Rothia sp. P13129]|uniref:hypothetical protein n=1 Tax=Rothia sp. P13129 TaxID=3402664 RepID=UPI003ACCC7D1
MSQNGFEDPHGDEPTQQVYIRRRIFALLALLLVLILLIWGFVSIVRALSGSSKNTDASASQATASSSSAAPFSDFTDRASASAHADNKDGDKDNKDKDEADNSASAQASDNAQEQKKEDDAQASVSAEAAETAAAEPTQEQRTEDATASETANAEPTEEQSPAVVSACSAADMAVSLTVDKNSYGAGQFPAMAVTYTNTAGTPCAVGGNAGTVDVNIISGPAQVYNYAQCNAAAADPAEIAAGATDTKVITWDRSLNVLGCGTKRTIQPGHYWATASVNGVHSKPVRIIVTG